jgi:hypothetical protein
MGSREKGRVVRDKHPALTRILPNIQERKTQLRRRKRQQNRWIGEKFWKGR